MKCIARRRTCRRKQKGGGKKVIGIIRVAIYDDTKKKLDPKTLSGEKRDKSDIAHSMVVDNISAIGWRFPVDEDYVYYDSMLDQYLPYGFLVEYDKDNHPPIPKSYKSRNGFVVKLEELIELGPTHEDREGGRVVPVAAAWPVGAGAGPVPQVQPVAPVSVSSRVLPEGYSDHPDPNIPVKSWFPGGPQYSSYKELGEYNSEFTSLELLPKELKGHEVRYFGQIPVYITTLPAGTLLFRGVRHVNAIYDDFLGYKNNIYDYMKKEELIQQFDDKGIPRPVQLTLDWIESPDSYVNSRLRKRLVEFDRKEGKEPLSRGDRALRPPYNVFFYPFPMVDKSVVEETYPTVVMYVVPQDVKIASLIRPSPYHRGVYTSGSFVEVCNDYDPCFTKKFIEKNPDVIGMIAIGATDAMRLGRLAGEYLDKYYTLYGDIRKEVIRGVPELILYPRRSLTMTNTIDSKDIAEIVKAIPDLTYLPYHIMEHRSEEKLATIIDTGLSGKPLKELIGFDDEFFIDKLTGFYISKKYYTGDMSRLIKDRSSLRPGDGIFDFPKPAFPAPKNFLYSEDSDFYSYLQMPPDWMKVWSKHTNQVWYFNKVTGKISISPPLPPGWQTWTEVTGEPIFIGPKGEKSRYFPYQVGGGNQNGIEIAWNIQPPSKEITEKERQENQQIQALNTQIARIMNTLPRNGGKRRRTFKRSSIVNTLPRNGGRRRRTIRRTSSA